MDCTPTLKRYQPRKKRVFDAFSKKTALVNWGKSDMSARRGIPQYTV